MTAFERTVTKLKPKSGKMLAEGRVGARLVNFPNGIEAVMKIAHKDASKDKNRPMQCGIPVESIPRREAAFYALSKLLHFTVVPETVLGEFKGHKASFQQYMTSEKLYNLEPRLRKPRNDKEKWVIALREVFREQVPRRDVIELTVLDFLACNRDRHAANYGVRLDIADGKARWRLVGWDNGCTFGYEQTKYHCVAHKYLFRYSFDLEPVWETLQSVTREAVISTLDPYLNTKETDHVWARLRFMLAFPYRMPWATLSRGEDDPDGFPAYSEFFRPMLPNHSLYILQSQ